MNTNKQSEPRKRSKRTRPMYVVIGTLCILFFAFVIFRIVLLQRVKQKLDAIRAAGYPVTIIELDEWYPEPPAGQNAAIVYADAFRAYFDRKSEAGADQSGTEDSNLTDMSRIDNLPVVGEGELPARSEPIPEEMLDDIAWYVEKNAEAIAFLHEAATIPECRYPVDMTGGFGILLPHLSEIRQGVRLFRLEAILAAEHGDSERAVRAVTTSLALGHSLKQEPILISYLVRIACNNVTSDTLERVLSRISLSDEQLARLAAALSSEEDVGALTRAMAAERCLGIRHFRTPRSLAMTVGRSSGPWKGLDFLYRASGLRDLDLNAYLGIMNTYVEQSEQPLTELADVDAEAMNRRIEALPRYYVMTRATTRALGAVYSKHARNIATIRCAMLAVAVERCRLAHGKLPEDLDALVPDFVDSIPQDPFDGKPLRFKKQEKGYIVYSVGMNRTDDGGTATVDKTSREYSRHPPDIVFTVER